jgi:quinol monooxygenase YgiN
MEFVIFARFHAREGQEEAVTAALREQVGPVRDEPGCLAIGAYASIRDQRVFWIHSRWTDEAAFEAHAELPRTDRFVQRTAAVSALAGRPQSGLPRKAHGWR